MLCKAGTGRAVIETVEVRFAATWSDMCVCVSGLR